MDRHVIKRARDVVTNATMSEILNEDPSGPIAFHDAVRQQVLALCTRNNPSTYFLDRSM